jgi:hypothetical protein
MNLTVQAAENPRADDGSAATPQHFSPFWRSQPTRRPNRCSYWIEHTPRTPIGHSHETRDSLIDSLKSHFRKERKVTLCLKTTAALSEAKKGS